MVWFEESHPRKLRLRSATLLVARDKSKRIKMPVTMPLDEGESVGFPDWLAAARDFAMKTGQTASDYRVIAGLNITYTDPNLFRDKPVESPRCELKNFVVQQVGESDDPSTVLTFNIYAAYSTDLWGWCGQEGGLEFTATFANVAVQPGDVLVLAPSEAKPEPAEEADDEEDNEDTPAAQARRREAKAVARAKKNLQVM